MRRRTDIGAGLIAAAFAAALLLWIIPANTSPPQSASNLSPSFLPNVAAGTVLILSLLLAFNALSDKRREDDSPHEEFGAEARGIGWRELGDTALWIVFGAAMVLGFTNLGFLVTSIAALALMLIFMGQRSPIVIAAISVIAPSLIQVTAWHAFGVQLP